MADHADTIRDLVERQRTYGSFYPSAHDLAALDALLAEAQRLRDALERIAAISPNSVYMQKIWLIADAALVEEADRG